MHLAHDIEHNTLRLSPQLDDETLTTPRVSTIEGILDVGEGGRLVGIEFTASANTLRRWLDGSDAGRHLTLDAADIAYLQITSGNDGLVRSTPITLTAEYDPGGDLITIVIPRRGEGYEITYPSGNQ